MLGAVVAPTDAVAATATFSRMHVPERVRLLVEGESMINDATALVAFRVALGGGDRGLLQRRRRRAWTSSSPPSAGVAIGLAAGWVEVHVLRKLDDRPLAILLSLLFPYASLHRRRGGRTSRASSPPSSAASTSAGSRTSPSTPTRA